MASATFLDLAGGLGTGLDERDDDMDEEDEDNDTDGVDTELDTAITPGPSSPG